MNTKLRPFHTAFFSIACLLGCSGGADDAAGPGTATETANGTATETATGTATETTNGTATGTATGTTSGTTTGAGGGPGTPGECVVTAPPTDAVESLEATWEEMTGQIEARGGGARPPQASILVFDNTILDQVMETGGSLNYCVRYESEVAMSAEQRDDLEAALERNVNEWFSKLQGVDCFPFDHIEVKVVGWAAMNRATFKWDDGDHPGRMYIGDNSYENAPQCAQTCGRFFHKEAGYQYPGCEGGRANHYDMSLWLTEGMKGGAGGDWGQRIGRGYFQDNVNSPTLHILSHEMGHGFGLPDYYNWSDWYPTIPSPLSVMVVASAFEVTDWDGWMLRRTWSELKNDRQWF